MSLSTSVWSPLRHVPFRGLWSGGAIYYVGNAMQAMAAAWLMVEITGSSFLAALVQTAVFLPMFVLSLPAGVLADTTDRRRLIIAALITQAVVGVLLALLVIAGWAGAAALLFFLPAILAGVATYLEPDTAYSLLPSGAHDLITRLERQELWFDIPVAERPGMAVGLMTNNIGVAFRAFAGGVLAGLFTLYILVLNGLLLGAVSGLAFHYGVGQGLWNFVIGHGVIELSIICFAGGAGLMLGNAILHRGQRTLKESLLTRGLDAIKIATGAALMLVVAAIIEAFWSPAPLPATLKYVVGAGLWLLVFLYLALAGRER